MIPIMKQNLIMMNVMNNLLKGKKSILLKNKNLIVCVNHALLDFYLNQYV